MTYAWFQDLNVCPEDESVILSSFYNTIAALSVKQGMCQSYIQYLQRPDSYTPLI